MLSEEKKFIFIHIPKTGGNSITTSLKKYAIDNISLSKYDGKQYNSIAVHNSKDKIYKHSMLNVYEKRGYDLHKYFKFSIVRNPWDRISSFFQYNIKTKYYPSINTMDKLIKHLRGLNDEQLGLYPQLDYFKNLNGEIVIDYIIKFDNLQEGFNIVCDNLKIERVILQKINESSNSKINYQTQFNELQKELIYNIYKEDIEYFKYEF